MSADNSEQIVENALAPKKVQMDGNSAEQHPIADQIAADEYAKNKTAATRAHRGLRFSKMIPPGMT